MNYWPNLALYLAFLPNLASSALPAVLCCAHCWSIGVEEQFYLLWPLLLQAFARQPLILFLGVILAKACTLDLLAPWTDLWAARVCSIFISTIKIEAMALGAMAAYIVVKRPKGSVKHIFLFASFLLPLLFTKFPITRLVELSVFALVIVASTKVPVVSQWLEGLGRISYGLYMLHPAVICAVLLLVQSNIAGGDVNIYGAVLAVTFALAAISYRFFERPFLKLKDRFSSRV